MRAKSDISVRIVYVDYIRSKNDGLDFRRRWRGRTKDGELAMLPFAFGRWPSSRAGQCGWSWDPTGSQFHVLVQLGQCTVFTHTPLSIESPWGEGQ